MSDLNQPLLDALPEAAVLIRQGKIAAANRLAQHYLPQLAPGAPVPSYITIPPESSCGTGTFTAGLSTYAFRLTDAGEDQWLLFHPAPQTALTDAQLDGALRQLRQFMGEFLAEMGAATGNENRAALQKSFHRMFRLLEHLELIHGMGGPDGVPFHPITMDLAGLCRQTVQAAASLLEAAGDTLLYHSSLPTLLIPGDPQLLQRLLLELISNSARAAGEGTVTVGLHSQGGRALLTVSDSGGPATPRQLAAMAQQDTDSALPLPGQGAGLGLPICRHIVTLHGGSLLVDTGQSAPVVLVSLPTAPLDPRATVKTPPLQRDGGLSPLLVGLADVLPAELFGLEDLD